ncbi:hypothetical protein APSETT445_003271 [Aspergillus pseudonomiae]
MADSARRGRRNNRASRNRRGKGKKDQSSPDQPEEALGNGSDFSHFGKDASRSNKLDAVRSSPRNHAHGTETPEPVRHKQEHTNSKHTPGSPLASKTDTKRQKADYPTPVPRILFPQPAPKCSISAPKVQDSKPLVSGKKVNSPEVLAKPASLLGLPAEIRWEIYQYLFEPHRVEILRRKDKNTDTSRPARYRLYHRQQKPRSPSTQAVDHQAAVRHVELSHIMYNEPRLMAFRTFKIRSDIAWYIACDEMASACVSLKVLHVRLAIYDWPIRLKIGEPWSMPLLLFGHYDGGLDYAGVQLQMKRFQDDKLRSVARALEQKMMKPKMFQIREDERLAKELMGPIKAKKILKLVV